MAGGIMRDSGKRKIHPGVTKELIEEVRLLVMPETTDEEIAQLMSDNMYMLEGWPGGEVQ